MNMEKYFYANKITKYIHEDDDMDQLVETEDPPHYYHIAVLDPGGYQDTNVTTRHVKELGNRKLPIHAADKHNMCYTVRTKLPLYRIFEAKLSGGDQVYYQNIVLHTPSFDFKEPRGSCT